MIILIIRVLYTEVCTKKKIKNKAIKHFAPILF